MFHMWSDPPVNPVIRVYIYNFTNLQDYLSGEAPMPVLNEVGPFTYSATHEKVVEGWDSQEGTVTFRTRSIMRPVQGALDLNSSRFLKSCVLSCPFSRHSFAKQLLYYSSRE